MTCELKIGSLNRPFLFSDTNHSSNWKIFTTPDETKAGWADVHDICCFQEISISLTNVDDALNRVKFRDKQLYICAGEGKSGVATAIKQNLCVTQTSLDWPLQDLPALSGRFLATEITLPTLAGGHINIWIVNIYAPATSADVPSHEFYTQLSTAIDKISCPFIYLAGDFNGCINPITDRFNPNRAPAQTQGDSSVNAFLNLETSKNRTWIDPIFLVHDYAHASPEFHTHKTIRHTPSGPPNITYTRIDHILSSALLGLTQYTSLCEVVDDTELQITHLPAQAHSDHSPVTLTLNLNAIDWAFNPHLYRNRVITRGKLPDRNSDDMHKLTLHLNRLRDILDPEALFMLNNPESIFKPENMIDKKKECNQYVRRLQEITGEIIPKPFRKSFNPMLPSIRWTPRILHLRKIINACKQIMRAVHILHRHRIGEHTYSTAKLRSCKDCISKAVHPIPSPTFALSPFSINDLIYTEWVQAMAALRQNTQQELKTETQTARAHQIAAFKDLYTTEAAKRSHRFRAIVFPATRSPTASVTILSNSGSRLILDAKGVQEQYRQQWKQLAEPAPVPERASGLPHFMNILSPTLEGIRNKISNDCHNIYKTITIEELRSYIAGKKNTAPSKNDQTTNQLLKLIIDDQKDLPGLNHLGKDLLSSLETLILGLLNGIIQTNMVPTQLLQGEIVPLYKSGDVRCLSNYRGITLLSCIYKLLTGIITQRVSTICESHGGFTAMQGGFRRGHSCLTKIATVQNIIRHAHRRKKPLYMFSSDIRKAFDTAHFSAFNLAFKHLGFDDRCIGLLDALQKNFKCEVRTPYGHTKPFKVKTGAKQGCPLSPLKFIILFDVFLKYLNERQLGYHWDMGTYKTKTPLTKRNPSLIIPGCALADDLIMFASSKQDFDTMVSALDDFLASAGMTMSPPKCQSIKINAPESDPPVRIHDHSNNSVTVHWQPLSSPLKYLGYLIPIGKVGLSHAWELHYDKVTSKAKSAADKLRRSRIAPHHAIQIANSDIISTTTYFLHAAYINSSQSHKLRSILWSAIKKKARLYSHTPIDVVFSKHGYGACDIHNLHLAGALDLLTTCLQSSDDYCRLSTTDTVQELLARYNVDIYNPDEHVHLRRLPAFPPFYKSAAVGLRLAGLKLRPNPNSPLHECSLHNTVLSTLQGSRHITSHINNTLRTQGIWYLRDLLPSLTATGEFKACPLERLLLREFNSNDAELRHFIAKDIDKSVGSGASPILPHSRRFLLVEACLKYFKNILSGDTPLPFTPASSREPIHLTTSNGSHHTLASDGSHDPILNKSGIGVASPTGEWSAPIPGKQGIDRAEAFALALAVKLADSSQPCQVYSDSKSTLDAVRAIADVPPSQLSHRKPRVANLSIILYIQSILSQKPRLRLSWVKAHTGLSDPASVLNDKADKAANAGRTTNSPGLTITESYGFLPGIFPETTQGEVIEGHYYSIFHENIDRNTLNNVISKELRKKSNGLPHRPSICNLQHPGIWRQAADASCRKKDGDHERLTLFKHKLSTSSLPTPYIKGRWHPGLYSVTTCELCGLNDKPDEYHYLCACTCPTIRQARIEAVNTMFNQINGVLHSPALRKHRLQQCIFPLHRTEFTHGFVPTTFLTLLDELRPSTETLSKVILQSQIWWSKAMHVVWIQSCLALQENGLDYATRISRRVNTPTQNHNG